MSDKFPQGWDEERVRRVLAHYEQQTEEEAVAEDEAAFEQEGQTFIAISNELLPKVRELISNKVAFEQVERLAVQLPPSEQLKLVAHISERLSGLLLTILPSDTEQARRREREAMADTLLAELDAIAESIEGEFDSAEDIRQIRQNVL